MTQETDLTVQEIDHITEAFYKCISFDQEHYPNLDQLQELFFGAGKLINNNFDKPLDFTVQSFAQALMGQIEAGNASFFVQQEVSDKTEIFGRIAQRISVYEYTFSKEAGSKWPRGVNYIQYIYTEGKWLITGMIWSDEKEGLAIPGAYLY